jgi:hypothetical protein
MAVKRVKRGEATSTTGNVVNVAFNTIATARQLLARGLGELFGGRRDLYTTFGYTKNFTYEEGLMRYRRLGIVSRVVNSYPDAVWTRPPQLVEGEGPKAAPGKVHQAMFELNKAIKLYHYVNRADKLAGIGPYSCILLGFDDIRSNSDLARPVERNKVSISYLQAYGFGQCKVAEWEDDATSQFFGMPKVYSLGMMGNVPLGTPNMHETAPTSWVNVHRDRIIHVTDSALDNDVYGYPILERVYNCMDDIEKVVGGSAEMFWLNGRGGLHIDVDKETQFTEAHRADLRQQVDDFMNDLTRVLRTRGVSVNQLASQGSNPEPVFNVIMSMVSIASGIPQRIFIGSEQGKLASEQDRANWAIRINERRVLQAEPTLLRPLTERLQKFGVIPSEEYFTQWPEAFQMSPLERSQTSAQQARALTNTVRGMQDFAKPIEGVDYPISRPGQQVVQGGGGGAGAGAGGGAGKFHKGEQPVDDKKKKVAAPAEGADKAKGKECVPSGKLGAGEAGGADKPEAPKPTIIPNEEIKVARREIISLEEARHIIFAHGELKSEGSIDHIPD